MSEPASLCGTSYDKQTPNGIYSWWLPNKLFNLIFRYCIGGSRRGHKLTTTQTSKATLKNRQVDFLAPMENISIPLGKDAVFTCKIDRDVQPEQLQVSF